MFTASEHSLFGIALSPFRHLQIRVGVSKAIGGDELGNFAGAKCVHRMVEVTSHCIGLCVVLPVVLFRAAARLHLCSAYQGV